MERRRYDSNEAQGDYGSDFDAAAYESNYNKQILTFVLNDIEIKSSTEKLKIHSKYFRNTLKDIQQSNIKIILPEWATKFALNVFLKFVNDDMLPKHIEPNDILKVLWISD